MLRFLARLFRRPLRCRCGQPALCVDERRRPLCADCAIRRYAPSSSSS